MATTDVQDDPFLTLLTDALRAGPGSPQWLDAVAKLRTSGASSANEYQLLLDAREHLENGKSYRNIHAGVGFTRKLMEDLDGDQPAKSRRMSFPTASLIALLASAALVLGLGWLGYHLTPRSGEVSRPMVDELASTYFPNDTTRVDFSTDAHFPPRDWRAIGTLPINNLSGLRPLDGTELAGGGMVLADPVPGDEPFAVEAELKVSQPTDNLVAQVFVSTSNDFSPDRATSSHELLWSLRGKSQQVVLNEHVLPQTSPLRPDGVVRLRMTVNREIAIVESNGARLWAGAHQLGPGPRWIGIRFIRSGPSSSTAVSVKSVDVLKR